MSHFTISAPILFIFIYMYMICNRQLLLQQFSALKTHKKPWKSTNFQFRPTTAQTPHNNSLPLTKFPPQNNRQPNQILILHEQIILFSSNSFAILSIPYTKFKIMNRPTSPNQQKRQQKALQSQGKLLTEPLNSTMLSPIHNHMEESIAFPKNLNRMAPQEPTRNSHIQNSLPPKKRQSDEQLNLQSDLSSPTHSSSKWHPTATQELLRILSQNSQPQQKSPPKANPNFKIMNYPTSSNQTKRQQKALQNQGKPLPEPPISPMISPIHNNMEESIAFPTNLNRMAPQEPTRIPMQNSSPPKKRQSDEQINLPSDPSPPTNSNAKWHPTATKELLRTLSQNSQPQQKLPPKEFPNPQINSFPTNTTLQINLIFANANTEPTTNSSSNTIQIKPTNPSTTYKKSPLDIFYPIPTQSPTWPSLQEANTISTHQHKKPKICKSDPPISSHAKNQHHLQISISTSQQNRSQNEIGKNRNEQHNKHRNEIAAISDLPTDCPQTNPQINRKCNPESSSSLPNANPITTPQPQLALQTNCTQAQGKHPSNITNPTTPASSINNQIEEHTVPPSPPLQYINRHKGHCNRLAIPAPQADCPSPHPHPNRPNNPTQGKHTQNPKTPKPQIFENIYNLFIINNVVINFIC